MLKKNASVLLILMIAPLAHTKNKNILHSQETTNYKNQKSNSKNILLSLYSKKAWAKAFFYQGALWARSQIQTDEPCSNKKFNKGCLVSWI